MKLKNRIQLLGLSTILVGGFVLAQVYIHNRNAREIKLIAGELAADWKEKLGLTPEQTKKLEANIVEFTILKNEIINSNRSKKYIVRDLQFTQQREHLKLKRFLNSSQFTAYVGVHKKTQSELLET